MVLEAFKTEAYPIGLLVEVPAQHVGIITARSSISIKGALTHTVIIDLAYSDSVKIILMN